MLRGETSLVGVIAPLSLDDTDFSILSKQSDWAMTTPDSTRPPASNPKYLLKPREDLPYNVFDSLSDYEPEATLANLARKKCPETSEWILTDGRFEAWNERRSHACLWLSGKSRVHKLLNSGVFANGRNSRIWQNYSCVGCPKVLLVARSNFLNAEPTSFSILHIIRRVLTRQFFIFSTASRIGHDYKQ